MSDLLKKKNADQKCAILSLTEIELRHGIITEEKFGWKVKKI